MHTPSVLFASFLTLTPFALAGKAAATTATGTWLTGLDDAQYSAFNSYTSSVGHDSKISASTSSVYATATGYTDIFDEGATSVEAIIQAAVTATTSVKIPDFPSDMPKEIKSFYSSYYSEQISILSKQRTNTATNAAPQETGFAKVAGMAAAGVLGVAAVL